MTNERKKAKRPKNLLLDPDAVARGEKYSRRHRTSLSRLVGDFLRSLPLSADESELTPAVGRLWGVGRSGGNGRDTYRRDIRTSSL